MKILLLLVFTVLGSFVAQAQTRTSTLTTNDMVYVVSTSCIGKVCRSKVSIRPVSVDRFKDARKQWNAQTEIICTEPRKMFGNDLERYAIPIDNDAARCIKSKKIKSWIINQNYLKYQQGVTATTMHPDYRPK